jgi:hypothetical protein
MKKNNVNVMFGLNINFKINVEKGIEFKFSNFNLWLATRVINTLVSYEGVGVIDEDVEKSLGSIKKEIITNICDENIKLQVDGIHYGSKEYNDAMLSWMNKMYDKYSCDITCDGEDNDVNILVTIVYK